MTERESEMAQDPLKFLRDRQGPARAPLIKEPQAAPPRQAAAPNRPVPPSRQAELLAKDEQEPRAGQEAAASAPEAEEAAPAAASAPAAAAPATPSVPQPEGTGRLIVGPAIKMKGEIGACDTLIVEGEVEASMSGRVMEVAEGGVFKGEVELEEARIAGKVEGSLSVSGLLTISRGGEVRGKVRYGELQIQSGGVIAGDIGLLGDAEAVSAPKSAKPSEKAASKDTAQTRDTAEAAEKEEAGA